jgi:hypothetical protein
MKDLQVQLYEMKELQDWQLRWGAFPRWFFYSVYIFFLFHEDVHFQNFTVVVTV